MKKHTPTNNEIETRILEEPEPEQTPQTVTTNQSTTTRSPRKKPQPRKLSPTASAESIYFQPAKFKKIISQNDLPVTARDVVISHKNYFGKINGKKAEEILWDYFELDMLGAYLIRAKTNDINSLVLSIVLPAPAESDDFTIEEGSYASYFKDNQTERIVHIVFSAETKGFLEAANPIGKIEAFINDVLYRKLSNLKGHPPIALIRPTEPLPSPASWVTTSENIKELQAELFNLRERWEEFAAQNKIIDQNPNSEPAQLNPEQSDDLYSITEINDPILDEDKTATQSNLNKDENTLKDQPEGEKELAQDKSKQKEQSELSVEKLRQEIEDLRVKLISERVRQHPLFHGELYKEDAEKLLAGEEIGSYIIRIFPRTNTTIIVSFVDFDNTPIIKHLYFNPDLENKRKVLMSDQPIEGIANYIADAPFLKHLKLVPLPAVTQKPEIISHPNYYGELTDRDVDDALASALEKEDIGAYIVWSYPYENSTLIASIVCYESKQERLLLAPAEKQPETINSNATEKAGIGDDDDTLATAVPIASEKVAGTLPFFQPEPKVIIKNITFSLTDELHKNKLNSDAPLEEIAKSLYKLPNLRGNKPVALPHTPLAKKLEDDEDLSKNPGVAPSLGT